MKLKEGEESRRDAVMCTAARKLGAPHASLRPCLTHPPQRRRLPGLLAHRRLTSVLSKRLEVNGDVMLLAAQGTRPTFQIISVARVLSDPLDFVAAIGFCCELGNGAL